MTVTANTVELVQIGEGLGVELPPDVLTKLDVRSGDSVSVRLIPGGGIEIRALTEPERQLLLAEKIMAERHGLLRRLAE